MDEAAVNEDKRDKRGEITLDATDAHILAAKSVNPKATTREIGTALGISKTTVARRLKTLGESDLVQEARQGLIDLLPAAVGIYRDVITPKKNSDIDTRLRVDVAGNILRGTGAHVEKNRTESASIPTTAEGLYSAVLSLSTYELQRFFSLCEGEDPGDPDPTDLVDGVESSPDASGRSIELQAQPVPDGDIPRPIA